MAAETPMTQHLCLGQELHDAHVFQVAVNVLNHVSVPYAHLLVPYALYYAAAVLAFVIHVFIYFAFMLILLLAIRLLNWHVNIG